MTPVDDWNQEGICYCPHCGVKPTFAPPPMSVRYVERVGTLLQYLCQVCSTRWWLEHKT